MSKKIYFGLAQWRHSQWYSNQSSVSSLQTYAKSFSTVEGNSSFYALPSEKNLKIWQSVSPEDFRFCFKFPKEISHKLNLSHCSRQVNEFLKRISILNEKLGVVWLQLDSYCDGRNIDKIIHFMEKLPNCFDYGIEVRHLDFYKKDSLEKRFNQFLQHNEINRVMFDTRSLFSLQRQLEAGELKTADLDKSTLDAFNAKPKVPAHIIATGKYPFVRIIIPGNRELGAVVIKQWVVKINQWLLEGHTPFIFFHTPDNIQAPDFAVEFSRQLALLNPNIEIVCLWNESIKQDSLF